MSLPVGKIGAIEARPIGAAILPPSRLPEVTRVGWWLSAARAAAATVATLIVTAGCSSGASGTPSSAIGVTAPGASSPATAASPARTGPPGGSEPSSRPSQAGAASSSPAPASPGPFRLTSPAFAENQPIPAEFTCHGADRSPPLSWTAAPPGTAALVLLVVDPDAKGFMHWSVLDLPAGTSRLPAGAGAPDAPIQQGRNDFGKVGYGGPCPPSGVHRYRFTLSAIARPLALSGHPTGTAVQTAVGASSVLAQATLVGTAAG